MKILRAITEHDKDPESVSASNSIRWIMHTKWCESKHQLNWLCQIHSFPPCCRVLIQMCDTEPQGETHNTTSAITLRFELSGSFREGQCYSLYFTVAIAWDPTWAAALSFIPFYLLHTRPNIACDCVLCLSPWNYPHWQWHKIHELMLFIMWCAFLQFSAACN